MKKQQIVSNLLWIFRGFLCSILLYPVSVEGQNKFQGMAIDSSQLEIRQIPDSSIQNYQADEDFSYYLTPPKLSFWDQFLLFLRQFFSENEKGTGRTIKGIFYLLAIIAVIGILFLFFKIGPNNIWAKSKKFVDGPTLTENELQELDFEILIKEAVDKGEYKKGMRLLYLETLKKLTEKEWIKWKPDKTNWEYVRELSGKSVQHDFQELTRYYEYVWYGAFPIDLEQFKSAEGIFRHFQLGMEGQPV